jgi:hypothetical protein
MWFRHNPISQEVARETGGLVVPYSQGFPAHLKTVGRRAVFSKNLT